MGEFKGTKGPWEARLIHSDLHVIRSGSFRKEGVTAVSYQPVVDAIDDADDANLIAAAPELLEALQEMVAIVKKHIYPQPDKPSSTWGRMEAAEAVISKALGQ